MLLPLLDDQPDVLAPRAALLRRRRTGSTPLVVSNTWRLGEAEVEVEDRVRGTTWHFALTPRSRELLLRLEPGGKPPKLDQFTETVLVDAGILVAGQQPGAELLPTARASFAADRFAVVPDALHPYEVAAVRRHLRHGIRTGVFPLGDVNVTRRHHAHNEPVLRAYQQRLLPMVTAIIDAPVKPSYAYLSAYTEGSVLPPHRDRPQCEYTITLQIDYTPEPALEAAWPIRVSLADAELTVYQSLGDALLFSGREHVHYRDPLPRGHISVSLLLHYVDLDFEGPLE